MRSSSITEANDEHQLQQRHQSMAEEGNAAHVVQSSKTVETAIDRGGGGGGTSSSNSRVLTTEERLEEEAGTLLRSPNDASPPLLRAEDPSIYQADVVEEGGAAVEGEDAPTTENPAAAQPAAAEAPAEGAGTAAADSEATAAAAAAEGGTAETTPADAAASSSPTAAASESPTPTGEATAATEKTPPESASSPAAGGEEATSGDKKESAELAEGGAAPGESAPTGAAADQGLSTAAPITTAISTGTPEPDKDPYAINIPLDKKINKRTQRKLWEEIEKRKPLIPKHVAQHIQKYAKPPFETWSCKFRGKGSCFGCK